MCQAGQSAARVNFDLDLDFETTSASPSSTSHIISTEIIYDLLSRYHLLARYYVKVEHMLLSNSAEVRIARSAATQHPDENATTAIKLESLTSSED